MGIEFFVRGEPKAQPRPRACKRGNHASVYDDGTADGWKWLVAKAAQENTPKELFKGAVSLDITLLLPRPKKHFYTTKKCNGELRDDAPIFHTAKPDADNYAKAIMDAISNAQCFWLDDSQVSILKVKKLYTNPGLTTGANICIEALD